MSSQGAYARAETLISWLRSEKRKEEEGAPFSLSPSRSYP
jgi:hypothetical protein